MKMYKCNECGHLFEEGEEKIWRECMGECHGFPAYEEFAGCPICKGDYEEVKPCKVCGTYDKDNDEDYCKNCVADVNKRMTKFIRLEFSEEEIELLREMFGGDVYED